MVLNCFYLSGRERERHIDYLNCRSGEGKNEKNLSSSSSNDKTQCSVSYSLDEKASVLDE